MVPIAPEIGIDASGQCLFFGLGSAVHSHGVVGGACMEQPHTIDMGADDAFCNSAFHEFALDFLLLLHATAIVGTCGAHSTVPHCCGLCARLLHPASVGCIPEYTLPSLATLCGLSQWVCRGV